jgi:hypothetical protein
VSPNPERRVPPTPEVRAMVRQLCEGWQDSDTFIQLHGLLQANLLAATLKLGNSNDMRPEPDALRLDAADLRCVVDGMAQFLEHLAERIEAKEN